MKMLKIDKVEKLCKIRDIQRAVNQFEGDFVRRHNICLNEGMALCSLAKSEKLSSGELGELLGVTSSNISKVIVSLEKKELIQRVMGTKDRRQMFFLLTDRGKQLLESIKCTETDIPKLLKCLL